MSKEAEALVEAMAPQFDPDPVDIEDAARVIAALAQRGYVLTFDPAKAENPPTDAAGKPMDFGGANRLA